MWRLLECTAQFIHLATCQKLAHELIAFSAPEAEGSGSHLLIFMTSNVDEY